MFGGATPLAGHDGLTEISRLFSDLIFADFTKESQLMASFGKKQSKGC
jgi:hypothetical protein